MKKLRKISLLFATLFITTLVSAQAFDDGKNLVSLGFGFPPTSKITQTLGQYVNDQNYDYKNYGTGIIKFEHGLLKYFGVGLSAEYSGAYITYNTTDPITQNVYTVAVNSMVLGFYGRLNGHYPIGDHLDIFAGVGLGYLYTVNSGNENTPAANSTTNFRQTALQFDEQFTLGVRYMIKEHFGLFAEIGSATTTVQMGITLGF